MSLPNQDDFIENHLQNGDAPADSQCTVCLEGLNSGEDVVKIDHNNKHTCYFHKECILSWFQSTNQKRGSCPNCRRDVFNPNKLTEAQVNAQSNLLPVADTFEGTPYTRYREAQQILYQSVDDEETVHLWEGHAYLREALRADEHNLELNADGLYSQIRGLLRNWSDVYQGAARRHVERMLRMARPRLNWLLEHRILTIHRGEGAQIMERIHGARQLLSAHAVSDYSDAIDAAESVFSNVSDIFGYEYRPAPSLQDARVELDQEDVEELERALEGVPE